MDILASFLAQKVIFYKIEERQFRSVSDTTRKSEREILNFRTLSCPYTLTVMDNKKVRYFLERFV